LISKKPKHQGSNILKLIPAYSAKSQITALIIAIEPTLKPIKVSLSNNNELQGFNIMIVILGGYVILN
jgi:hypothetical protein